MSVQKKRIHGYMEENHSDCNQSRETGKGRGLSETRLLLVELLWSWQSLHAIQTLLYGGGSRVAWRQ
jgi:hypothetical protein